MCKSNISMNYKYILPFCPTLLYSINIIWLPLHLGRQDSHFGLLICGQVSHTKMQIKHSSWTAFYLAKGITAQYFYPNCNFLFWTQLRFMQSRLQLIFPELVLVMCKVILYRKQGGEAMFGLLMYLVWYMIFKQPCELEVKETRLWMALQLFCQAVFSLCFVPNKPSRVKTLATCHGRRHILWSAVLCVKSSLLSGWGVWIDCVQKRINRVRWIRFCDGFYHWLQKSTQTVWNK